MMSSAGHELPTHAVRYADRSTSVLPLTSSSRRRWEWDKRAESGERTARENGHAAGHELRPALFPPSVRGPAGGAGCSVALGPAVQFCDSGLHHITLDDRVHDRLLDGVWYLCPEDAAKGGERGSAERAVLRLAGV
jgi:hypothetical protein